MEKRYNSQSIEKFVSNFWENINYFKTVISDNKDNFSVIMPPPNITGNLHIGHALQQTLIDIIIRYHRMMGMNVLWQMGIDHAGIATQIVVEQDLILKEKKSRFDYKRRDFVKKIWQWKTFQTKTINNQLKKLGCFIDQSRMRFTMDYKSSIAVKEAFIRLYKDNLIYRSQYLVHWDPKLQTVVSDLEVEYRKLKNPAWYIRYPLTNGVKSYDDKNYIVVMSTRPETLFGDSGIAVNPKDSRYKNLVGKFVVLPLLNRCIPIVADELVDINKGTGCMKITPAHDFLDFNIGKKHKLLIINILATNGNILDKAQIINRKEEFSDIFIPSEYQNLNRFTARDLVVMNLSKLGFIDKTEFHITNIPYNIRNNEIVEPMITNQWFIRTKPLSKVAIQAVKSGKIKFIPKQYENMYLSWMNNIEDWCISRQLWWGHRIPVWYDDSQNIYVGYDIDKIRKENKLPTNINLKQDKDVLDTWFSSGIWTFTALGWPKDTIELKRFHPTNLLVSGFDIIFFWIARMIMLTMYLIKDQNGKPQVPFKTVYLTGLVRDYQGEKMSKSKGNIIDPVDVIDGITFIELLKKHTSNNLVFDKTELIKNTKKQFPHGIEPYGADALRITLASSITTGRDILWNMNRLKGYRNFCNKLWNASRFILTNIKNCNFQFQLNSIFSLDINLWIIDELNSTINKYHEAIKNYRFDILVNIIYTFVWDEFCNWYIELAKSAMVDYCLDERFMNVLSTLLFVLESILLLLHPIMPFITEKIWSNIRLVRNLPIDNIISHKMPIFDKEKISIRSCNNIKLLKSIITTIGDIRSIINIPQSRLLNVYLYTKNDIKVCIQDNFKFLLKRAHLKNITVSELTDKDTDKIYITKLVDDTKIIIPISDIYNINTVDLEREIKQLDIKIKYALDKISNHNFATNVSKRIDKEYQKIEIYKQLESALIKQINL